MIEEIKNNLFRLEIPLPNSPLKSLNSYIIKDKNRNLIIDTGLNQKECLEAMQAGLQKLSINLEKTDLFITHLHADHFGLVSKLATKNSKVYFNRPDSELVESWDGWGPMIAYGGLNGFPKHELQSALNHHPGHKFGSEWIPELSILQEGDKIEVGDYRFTCIETPGHSMGHMCLYEPSKKIFVAGDHILIDITPNIQCWSDKQNPLADYLKSLDKVSKFDIELVLPGHRRLIKDYKGRIEELKNHHYKRLDEIISILKNGAMNGYEVASKMKWDINCETWEEFPVAQKWFATGEAISHLRYLEENKTIIRKTENEIITFSNVK
jgi:glyoxylase-like metal-dependent hydrolase (beta-lactamase superfamily II)